MVLLILCCACAKKRKNIHFHIDRTWTIRSTASDRVDYFKEEELVWDEKFFILNYERELETFLILSFLFSVTCQ